MPILAGASQPEVKRYLGLRSRGTGAVAADGLWSLRRAVEVGAAIEAVFRCPELSRGPDGERLVDELERSGVPTFEVSARMASRMAERDGPDGLFAIVEFEAGSWESLPDQRLMVLDGLESAGNLGTLLRLADAVGAGVVLADSPVRLESPKVLHASMATVLHVPIVRATWRRSPGVVA